MVILAKTDGSDQSKYSKAFESGGGEITPIPNNTALIAAIEEAGWARLSKAKAISI